MPRFLAASRSQRRDGTELSGDERLGLVLDVQGIVRGSGGSGE